MRALLLSTTLLFSSTAAAQAVTATAILDAPLTVRTSSTSVGGGIEHTSTLPAGTDLAPGAVVVAGASPSHESRADFNPLVVAPREVEFSMRSAITVPRSSNSSGGARLGASMDVAEVLLTLSANVPVRGQIVVTEAFDGLTDSFIDIGDDGVREWISDPFFNFPIGYPRPRVESFSVAFGPGALVVRVGCPNPSTLGSFTGPLTLASSMSVRFVPDDCAATAYGTGCAGTSPLSAAADFTGDVELSMPNAQPGSMVFAVLGFTRTQLVIPVLPLCTLWTSPDVSVPMVVAGGQATLQLPLGQPGGRPVLFNAQGAIVDFTAATLLLTEPLELNCR